MTADNLPPLPELDAIATALRARIGLEGISERKAAKLIGIGASTLGRLLNGSANQHCPDTASIAKAAEWSRALDGLTMCVTCGQPVADALAARAQPDELARDAERYRKWRDEYTNHDPADPDAFIELLLRLADAWEPADVDTILDAAIAASKEKPSC